MLTIIRKIEKFYWACQYEYYHQLCDEYYEKLIKSLTDGNSELKYEKKYDNVAKKRRKAYRKFMELRDC